MNSMCAAPSIVETQLMRVRNKDLVAYFPHMLEEIAAHMRDKVMWHAQMYRVDVKMAFPEVLLQGFCFERTTDYCVQNTEHEVIQLWNDEYATYLPASKWRDGLELALVEGPLKGAQMKLAKVITSDVEALTHGNPVRVCPSRKPSDIQKFASQEFMKKYGIIDIAAYLGYEDKGVKDVMLEVA